MNSRSYFKGKKLKTAATNTCQRVQTLLKVSSYESIALSSYQLLVNNIGSITRVGELVAMVGVQGQQCPNNFR